MAAPPPNPPMNPNMEIPGGPPMPNVLYPHHVGLMVIILVYHREPSVGGPTALHPKVRMRMLRVLAREIGELDPPTPYYQLVSKLVDGFGDPSLDSELAFLSHSLKQAPKIISTPEVMGDLFSDARGLVPGVEEPEDNANSFSFERRSFFGMFIRKSFLTFRKLSFAGQLRLCKDFVAWSDGDKGAGYYLTAKDRRKGLLIFPGILDLPENAKQSYFEIAENSLKSGDGKVAADNLRRFFDQRFAATDDTTLYQHSLLSMATLHYTKGELLAARQFLDEAIKISREKNDHLTLDRCQNLMQRLQPDPGSAFLARDRAISVKVWANPLEVLWEIKRLLELGEGLKIMFTKVAESIGVWDAKSVLTNAGVDKWPRHAVCAVLWRLAGMDTLAKCHENIILAFTQAGSDNSRMAVVCAKASRYTRQGTTDEALKILLDPQTWRGLTFQQYQIWALEVWNVFNFTAERKGHASFQGNFLTPNRPAPRPEVQSTGVQSPFHRRTVITESLQLALRYKEAKQPVPAIQPLMEAIWTSEFRGMFQYYRIAVVLLADIAIDLGLSKSAQRFVEEILPQILLGDDLELRAYGSLTYARCIMAGAGAGINEQVLKEARPHLIRSVKDYRAILKYDKTLEALLILSVVCHNLRAVEERDNWSAQFTALDAERRTALSAGVGEETIEIFKIIREVAYGIGQEEK